MKTKDELDALINTITLMFLNPPGPEQATWAVMKSTALNIAALSGLFINTVTCEESKAEAINLIDSHLANTKKELLHCLDIIMTGHDPALENPVDIAQQIITDLQKDNK